MKSLTFALLLALFLFQVSYAQEEAEIEFEVEDEVNGGVDIIIPVAGQWYPYDLETFNTNDFDQRVLNFGAQWAISQLIGYHIISESANWNVSQVNSVDREVDNGVNYAINVVFGNDVGEFINSAFVVNSQYLADKFQVLSVAYSYADGDVNATAIENAVLPVNSQENEEEDMEYPPLINADAAESEVESNEVLVGGWSDFDLNEAQNDQNIQQLLNEGVASAIQKGLDDGALPAGDWAQKSLLGVQSQVVAGINYLFLVLLTNQQATNAQAAIFVYQDLDNASSVVSSGIWSVAPLAVSV